MPSKLTEDIWAEIHSKSLDDRRKLVLRITQQFRAFFTIYRSEIIFQVAVQLESSALLLSSTTNGYKDRIGSIRNDITALSKSNLWDSGHPEFEDAQEIIQYLRQHSLPTGKGKHRVP